MPRGTLRLTDVEFQPISPLSAIELRVNDAVTISAERWLSAILKKYNMAINIREEIFSDFGIDEPPLLHTMKK